MHQQLLRYRELELRVEIPPALFKCGQSVLQWWAPWMKDAEETPASYNKKNRPAWFSAEVCSYKVASICARATKACGALRRKSCATAAWRSDASQR